MARPLPPAGFARDEFVSGHKDLLVLLDFFRRRAGELHPLTHNRSSVGSKRRVVGLLEEAGREFGRQSYAYHLSVKAGEQLPAYEEARQAERHILAHPRKPLKERAERFSTSLVETEWIHGRVTLHQAGDCLHVGL